MVFNTHSEKKVEWCVAPYFFIEVELYWQALKQGGFKDEFDFCVNRNIEFLSVEHSTIVQ